MSVLVGVGGIGVALAGGTASYLWLRDRRSQERRERRRRHIGHQRAWTWLMRPRVGRLTDQRENRD